MITDQHSNSISIHVFRQEKRGATGDVATQLPIQPRLRAPSTRLLCSCNINADVKGKIISTLLKLNSNRLEEQTALFYLQCMDFGSEEYHCAIAKTLDEAAKLIEQGFDYICDVDGVKLFRKRK